MRRAFGLITLLMALFLAGCGQASPTPSTPKPTKAPKATPTATPLPKLTTEQIQSLALSSVFIEALITEEGELITGWSGSGTLLSANGIILTNAHIVTGADALVVSLTRRTDQPPIPSYYAEPIEISNVLDLALIQVTSDIDGNEIEPGLLRLPFAPRGDSDNLELGANIHVFGFPGVGGETLTFTKGTVSGFETDDLGKGSLERVWIKSDAEISPGNSGGTAVDDRGFLVGVPTFVTSDDRTAGRISRLRPTNLVVYLITQPPQRIVDAALYEPNDDQDSAYGPLEAGITYTAFLHQNDIDFYYFETQTSEPIHIFLTDIAEDVDYDLYLLYLYNDDLWSAGESEGETSTEAIAHTPWEAGTFYIAVVPYKGYSLEEPYVLQALFDGASVPPILPEWFFVTIKGRVVDANTGEGIAGAVFSLLVPGVTGEEFIDENMPSEMIQTSSITDEDGAFSLHDVPRGQTYTGIIITDTFTVWENDWITIWDDDPPIVDVGEITVSSE
ncbi:MAG: trypsin-like serine protease [Anaerolineales bacterium]|nr:trypsin-like serine protease [Anaerolineales bacterium]